MILHLGVRWIFPFFKRRGSISCSMDSAVMPSLAAIVLIPVGLFVSLSMLMYFLCRGVSHPSSVLIRD